MAAFLFTRAQAQQFNAHGDGREHVVQIVRDAAGEHADAFHALRTEQLLLNLLFLGDILFDSDEMGGHAGFVADRRDGHLLLVNRAVFAPVLNFAIPSAAGQDGVPHPAEEFLVVQAGLQHARGLAGGFRRSVAGELGEGGVDPFDEADAIGDHDGAVGRTEGGRLQLERHVRARAVRGDFAYPGLQTDEQSRRLEGGEPVDFEFAALRRAVRALRPEFHGEARGWCVPKVVEHRLNPPLFGSRVDQLCQGRGEAGFGKAEVVAERGGGRQDAPALRSVANGEKHRARQRAENRGEHARLNRAIFKS